MPPDTRVPAACDHFTPSPVDINPDHPVCLVCGRYKSAHHQEPPDFNAIALSIMDASDDESGQSRIAEQLRLVWNARGAADLALVDAHLPRAAGGTVRLPDLDRALRALDR